MREIITTGLARYSSLALLQTKMVLTRPWRLMELFFARRNRITFIPLHSDGRGYDHIEDQTIATRRVLTELFFTRRNRIILIPCRFDDRGGGHLKAHPVWRLRVTRGTYRSLARRRSDNQGV